MTEKISETWASVKDRLIPGDAHFVGRLSDVEILAQNYMELQFPYANGTDDSGPYFYAYHLRDAFIDGVKSKPDLSADAKINAAMKCGHPTGCFVPKEGTIDGALKFQQYPEKHGHCIACLERKAGEKSACSNSADTVLPVELSDLVSTVEGLQYIASSPPREHGGFHPETVAIAKNSLLLIEAMHHRLMVGKDPRDKSHLIAVHEMEGAYLQKCQLCNHETSDGDRGYGLTGFRRESVNGVILCDVCMEDLGLFRLAPK